MQNMKNVELLKAINIMWIYLSVIMLIWQGYSLFLWKENWIQIRHCYTNMAKSYKVINIILRKSNIIEEVNENESVKWAHYLPQHAMIKSDRESSKKCTEFNVSAKIDRNESS